MEAGNREDDTEANVSPPSSCVHPVEIRRDFLHIILQVLDLYIITGKLSLFTPMKNEAAAKNQALATNVALLEASAWFILIFPPE